MNGKILTERIINPIYKSIPGFEGYYEITENGDVLTSGVFYRLCFFLKPSVDRYGYSKVVLTKENKRYYFTVHRLVAMTFIPNPDKKPQVNHKNGNRKDNNVKNLEWATAKENVYHSFRFGNQIAIMKPVRAINLKSGEEYIFNSQREASRYLKISQAHISKVLLGIYKQTNGYAFLHLKDGETE